MGTGQFYVNLCCVVFVMHTELCTKMWRRLLASKSGQDVWTSVVHTKETGNRVRMTKREKIICSICTFLLVWRLRKFILPALFHAIQDTASLGKSVINVFSWRKAYWFMTVSPVRDIVGPECESSHRPVGAAPSVGRLGLYGWVIGASLEI